MAKPAPAFLPPAFLDATRAIMPDHLSMDDFIAICQKPLRRSLRVNTLKISVADFLALVKDYDWRLEPIPWCPEGFWIEREDEALRLGSAAEHLSGLFYIQEASSMLPVSALFAGRETPRRVLDVAAAPGSKTTQIAALMGNQGGIVANEYSASRVKVLHANISRCGVKNTALTHFDGRVFGAALPESFDAILLDAPCSGEGVVRKDPDAMSNWSPESVTSIAQTQWELIDSAFHALAPGGVMVYSTCTLNAQENQQVVHQLLATYGDAVSVEPLGELFPQAQLALTPEGFLHVFPQIYDSEGFFVARLRKNHSVPALAKPSYKLGKFPFAPLSAQESSLVAQAAAASGLVWDETSKLWARDKEIWLFPAALEPLVSKVRFSRIGLKLAERFPKGFRWQHEAVIALAASGNPQTFELDAALAQEWFHGRDLYPSQPPQSNECIVTYQHQPLGLAKLIGSRIKNSLPRELVRDGVLDFHQ
ncbi:16S rRNA (cytosine(1407)-C(5))-methyltransferase RsmF [Serratia fonticola]|uniref:Ribosomal RNA small subunit methyltransferase F n=1 Tax=Serratia fonticola TaxID=47917 RepID=A0ABY9PVP6_SERFO|nr:16S rRNA (cytosine(1407)-C(5))-methyltransferase RsmF [Serratia fonticola]MBL5829035.1 16S rRNA (cytosine(1407)-C(5))-methyltransferase RsmF [Serratia fonticola]MBL5859808.1 16S rRNA (cytosine(1407)-C(5))-methyltransferase RsmF [Serratia fonticola]MCO7509001.1 16S rRNA (cytosine(1407)-C(5))-methyltransferase RsmF [Serratia fonticola]MDK2375339.1 16S rRNA (cytosine(1407)-C(5))-methyltransferase RsmF [Serratia fonticola]NBJ36085.1 16S rRNA (cytosine(1407)-C(5))-methyltransferase RsmF [Serrati